MKKIIILFILILRNMHADEIYNDTSIIVPQIYAVIINLNENEQEKDEIKQDVYLNGLALSSKQMKDLAKIIRSLAINNPLTQVLLTQIKKEISKFYQSIHQPLVLVQIPEQDITEGILRLHVIESKLGEIHIKHNQAFKEERYKSYLRIQEGNIIKSDELTSDISWINRNPFRSVQAIYSAGEKIGTTDIDLVVDDRRPLTIYSGMDNSGNSDLGKARVFVGVNWGNCLFLDHILNYQYTSSMHLTRLMAHSLSYTIPLPWRHILRFYGGYSLVNSPHAEKEFHSRGTNWQVCWRYLFPFKDEAIFKEIRVGNDIKSTNNNLLYDGEVIEEHQALIAQISAGFSCNLKNSFSYHTIDADIFISPGKIFDKMDVSYYNVLRKGASNKYLYLQMKLDQLYSIFNTCSIRTKAEAQLSLNKLLPSEQLSLGGIDSVRGYPQRACNVDSGFLLSIEPCSPTFSLIKKYKDQCTLYFFVDYGYGLDTFKPKGERKNNSNLLGIGPGITYYISKWLKAKVDWGYQLLQIKGVEEREQLSFSVVMSL